MKKISNITIILPVHELVDDKNITLFNNAIKSVTEQSVMPDELLIVVPKGSDVEIMLNEMDMTAHGLPVRIISNDGKTDFQSQVNFGAKEVKTGWMSILEFDDEYSIKWIKNAVTYIEAHNDVEVFLPIIIDTDVSGEFIGLTNEAVWANSFSDKLGFLDEGALLAYQNFNIDGFVIKTETFLTKGGLKSNIKLTFIYEFLLRLAFTHVKIMVIPRYGYKHMNGRDNSLFDNYKNEMNSVESKWWLAQAKKEYYFPNEREITFQDN